jgi:hypothetical protein
MRHRNVLAVLLLLLAAGTPARAADEPSPTAVNAAIAKGKAWLEQRYAEGFTDENDHDLVELTVLTLSHAGANLKDTTFAEGVTFLEKVEPRFTYRTSLLAMALGEVNPRLYQSKIAHCAQWLVDTQLAAGEWGYPGTVAGNGAMPAGMRIQPPPPDEKPAEGAKPGAGKPGAPKGKITIVRRSSATSDTVLKGDFSNTQFAILGLRACREAGIEVPKETWKAALAYLRSFQRPDGGWGYVVQGEQDGASYASLTCAGACSLAICLAATGASDVKGDAGLKKALAWLDKNLDVARNVGIDQSEVIGPSPWQYYHLYSLERIGRALNLETVGKQRWYPAGATWLLAAQQADGHWADGEGPRSRPSYFTPADTCFALLFLTRATRPVTGG